MNGGKEQVGLYVYCVICSDENVSPVAAGIEGCQVYTVPHNDLCALVHDCPAQPYQSNDPKVVAAWVMAHHQVVETAWQRWGMVLPMKFNTIIRGEEGTAEQNLRAWLEKEYRSLKGKLEALAGKAEYSFQVFWDIAVVAKKVADASPEIRKLQEEISAKPRGVAYMYRQKLEAMLKKEMEAKAAEDFKQLYNRLNPWVDNIHVEKTKGAEEGRQMLLNLSCLVSMEKYPELEVELNNQMGKMEGFSFRLVGPLPPYSFC